MLTVLLTGVLLALSAMTVVRFCPRCPECGSLTVTTPFPEQRIWVCDNCQNVFRIR